MICRRYILSSVAEISLNSGPEQINRRERQRAITIQVTPPITMPLEDAMEQIDKSIVKPLTESAMLDGGYLIRLSGTADKLRQAWAALKWNLLLALAITYLLMAALFESFLYPLVIMISVPLAAFGGVLARRWPRLRPGASLPAVAFVLMISAHLWALPNHLDLARWGSLGTRLLRSYGDIQRLSVWIKENTPPDATLMCSRAPVQSVLTGRTAYTYRFLHRFPSEPMYFERYQPDYVFFDIMVPESFKVQRRVATRFDLLTRLDSSYGPESLLVYAPPPGAAPR